MPSLRKFRFRLNVPDLKPNIGLFWYFFTEMFEHFRPLFLCSFQINATLLYLTPLSIRLRGEPVLLMVTLIALTAIFKSYPSLGDVGFYLALLPMWKHLFQCMYSKNQLAFRISISIISEIFNLVVEKKFILLGVGIILSRNICKKY